MRPPLLVPSLRLLLCALVVAAVALPATAGPEVGTTAAGTYGEWSAAWWQWMVSIPAEGHPSITDGAIDCGVNQQGPVWFLANAPGGRPPFERSCTVPTGKWLFTSIVNTLFGNLPGEETTVAEKREIINGILSDTEPGFFADLGLPGTRPCRIFAELDGQPVAFENPIVRVQSPPFFLDTNEGAGFLPPGIVDPEGVSDGLFFMLPPLSKGEHTLHYGGDWCVWDSAAPHPILGPVDVIYHLTVTGSGE